MNLKKRLVVLIENIEKYQQLNYEPIRSITLSYLYDLRDDNLPKHLTKEV